MEIDWHGAGAVLEMLRSVVSRGNHPLSLRGQSLGFVTYLGSYWTLMRKSRNSSQRIHAFISQPEAKN